MLSSWVQYTALFPVGINMGPSVACEYGCILCACGCTGVTKCIQCARKRWNNNNNNNHLYTSTAERLMTLSRHFYLFCSFISVNKTFCMHVNPSHVCMCAFWCVSLCTLLIIPFHSFRWKSDSSAANAMANSRQFNRHKHIILAQNFVFSFAILFCYFI